MIESEYTKLSEVAWRRPLTGEEKARLRAYLSAHPGGCGMGGKPGAIRGGGGVWPIVGIAVVIRPNMPIQKKRCIEVLAWLAVRRGAEGGPRGGNDTRNNN